MAEKKKPEHVEKLIAKHEAAHRANQGKTKGISAQMLEWLGIKMKDEG